MIALIVLFVLLLIGFVFIGILNRNLVQTNTSRQRSLAADLADAGIRYVHTELLDNPLGADYRPAPTLPLTIQDSQGNSPPVVAGPLYTTDPDEYYLRPAPLTQGSMTQTFGQMLHAGDLQVDMGGPDGLGPFSRVMFKSGRALVRVRYAPSDLNVTTSATYGPLLNPGQAHNFIIIESIGRPGVLNANDPTSIPPFQGYENLPGAAQFLNLNLNNKPQAVMYQWFNSVNDLRGAVGFWSQLDSQWVESRKLMAFASIGIIDHARFETNLHHSSNPIPIGISADLGSVASDDLGNTAPVQPPLVVGNKISKYNVPGGVNWPGGGGTMVNGDAQIYGDAIFSLNQALGENIAVAGSISGSNGLNQAGSYAQVNINAFNGSTPVVVANPITDNPANDTLDSSSPLFSTYGGLIRDGIAGSDANGDPRGVTYQPAPDIMHIDPDTGFNRYLTLTRDSGSYTVAGNSGFFGHGAGVYVDNGGGDLQIANDANGLIAAGASQDLVNEWLSSDSAQPGSHWIGQYYTPPGAYLQLMPDGFKITLDNLGTNKTWKKADGTDTGSPELTYRVSTTNPPLIVDTTTANGTINNPVADFTNGKAFNGVLYFEGNVRVRGIIPTYCPLTVVSMGNIYIEGSIVKGVVDMNGNTIANRAPQTGIGLLARDYVVLNTSQFFGPIPGSNVAEKNSGPENVNGLNPVVLPAAGPGFELWSEFLLDPDHAMNGAPVSLTTPQDWPMYASEYVSAGAGPQPEYSRMILTHTSDDGPAPDAFVSLNVNPGVGASSYLFPQPNGTNDPIYELGQESYQRYSAFETSSFELLLPSNTATLSAPIDPAGYGAYSIGADLPTFFGFGPNSTPPTTGANDYLVGRTAIVPDDIRIQAVIYAEEGSFFVIPGPWFNPNQNDIRSAGDTSAAAQLTRLQTFGNDVFAPFYQEPLDVKVVIEGSINENLPAPMSDQVQWDRKWSWIPATHGDSGETIPTIHNAPDLGFDVANGSLYVPNLFMTYDPVLATGRVNGFQPSLPTGANPAIRTSPQDPTGLSMLPPLPCLPVSPTLVYFGENP